MSPSETVRALLDERGIEHDDNDANTEVTGVRITRWKNGGKRDVRYEEWRNGTTRLDAGNVSPEQAIAATVTTEPDEATMLKLHSRMNAALLDMNEELLAYHSQDRENASSKKLIDSVIAAHQIIEDAAAVGVGTCHTVGMSALGNPPFNKSGLSTNSMECGCSECGAPWSTMGIFRGNTIKHNFKACPICGRRIIKEATE